MIRVAAALVLLLLIPTGPPSQSEIPDALIGGRVYVAPMRPPIEDATLILSNGIITAVGPRSSVPVPSNARLIDCQGRTLLAAFWNSHVHFTETKWTTTTADPKMLQPALDAMLLQYGFASVFDTGSVPAATLALRRRIDAGEIRGPAILTTGLPFVPRDGTPVYVEPLLLPELTSAEAARAGVRARLNEGVDGIKLMTTSITKRQDWRATGAASSNSANEPMWLSLPAIRKQTWAH